MKYFFACALAVLLFGSCKKDRTQSPPPPVGGPPPGVPPPAPPPMKGIAVKLDQPYLAINLVDSAILTWKQGNDTQRVKMIIRNDSLLADPGQFKEGNGTLEIELFTDKRYANQYKGQWLLRKTLTMSKQTGVSYMGPANFEDPDWFPRVEIKDAMNHVAIAGLRPDDPYFLIKDPGHPFQQLEYERSYWQTIGGVNLVAGKLWTCTSNCFSIPNETFFQDLPDRIAGRTWNHISIWVIYRTEPAGGGWVLSIEINLAG